MRRSAVYLLVGVNSHQRATNMPQYEEYVASWMKASAVAGVAGAAVRAFTIKVRFIGGLTVPQKNAFKRAADGGRA